MGGSVSISTPLAGANQKILAEKYLAKSSSGMSDDDINAELALTLPSIILFNQIDADHSGTVTLKELKRLLKSLPRKKPIPPEGGWPGGKSPPYLTIDKMLDFLDTDSDGVITMDEWIDNMEKEEMGGLKQAINGAVNKESGKIVGYQSLESRLASLIEARKPLAEELAKIDKQIESLKKSVGAAGVIVFHQIDLDNSGTIEKKELLRVLKQLPRPKDIKGPKMSIEDILATLDVDGDGTINEEEWLAKLDSIPALKSSVEQAIGEDGRIKGYRSLGQQLFKLKRNLEGLEERIKGGEEGPAMTEALEKKKAAIKKLEDKGIVEETLEE